MTIQSRSRARNTEPKTRWWEYNGKKYNQSTSSRYYERTEDIIGDYGGIHTFYNRKHNRHACYMSGGQGGYSLHNYYAIPPYQNVQSRSFNENDFATTLIARTNPSRPHVSIPTFLIEGIKDFPRLIRGAGDTILSTRKRLRQYASANLGYHFAWKPLISDLIKFTQFQNQFDRRMNELKRLTTNGLARRLNLEEYTDSETFDEVYLSSAPSVYELGVLKGIGTQTLTSKVWGTIKWTPRHEQVLATDAERARFAKLSILGLHPNNITQNIWDSLPWTWLIDWCSNVGTYFGTYHNTLEYTYSDICIMRTTDRQSTWNITQKNSNVTLEPAIPSRSFIQKYRYTPTGGATVFAKLPCLTARQLSILGSLAILKGR